MYKINIPPSFGLYGSFKINTSCVQANCTSGQIDPSIHFLLLDQFIVTGGLEPIFVGTL